MATMKMRQVTIWNGGNQPVRFYITQRESAGLVSRLMKGPEKIKAYRYLETEPYATVIINMQQSSVIEVMDEVIPFEATS